MPQFLIRLAHSSDQCPLSNSKVRERVTKGTPEMPQLAQRLGVRFIAGPTMLAAEHEGVAIVEAATVEAVDDLILQSGLAQWNTVRVSRAKPLDEVLGDFAKAPPPIY